MNSLRMRAERQPPYPNGEWLLERVEGLRELAKLATGSSLYRSRLMRGGGGKHEQRPSGESLFVWTAWTTHAPEEYHGNIRAYKHCAS